MVVQPGQDVSSRGIELVLPGCPSQARFDSADAAPLDAQVGLDPADPGPADHQGRRHDRPDTLRALTDRLSISDAVELLDALHGGRRGAGSPTDAPVVMVDVDAGGPVADLEPPAGWPGVLVAVSRAVSPP